jgi:hypothetical protein
MVLSSKGSIERSSRRGVRLGNILKQLSFGDWLVLSLLGSNVQSSYYEQIILAVAEKLQSDLKKIPTTDGNGPLRLNCISSAGLEETDRFLVHEDQETAIADDEQV